MADARDWVITPLASDRIDQAFPLVQADNAALTLEQWRQLATDALTQPRDSGGIVTVQFLGYLNVVFVYRIDDGFDGGRVLIIDMFRVLDIIDPARINRVLRRAIAVTAERFDCIAIRPPLGGDALASHSAAPTLEPCPVVWLTERNSS